MEKLLNERISVLSSILFIFVVFFVMIAMSGCATQNLSWNKLTTKGKAAMALGLYNDEYDNYLIDVKRPNLSAASKNMLKKKKQILTKLAKVITIYTKYAQAGTIPPDDVESELVQLLSQISVK